MTRRGSWEVAYRASWSSADRRMIWDYLLYRQRGGERRFVAEHVRGYDFYPDDCIVFHSSGPGPSGYFAACGDRRPLRLSSGPNDGWRLHYDRVHGNALELLERNGEDVVVVRQRQIKDILREAKAQPPFFPAVVGAGTQR